MPTCVPNRRPARAAALIQIGQNQLARGRAARARLGQPEHAEAILAERAQLPSFTMAGWPTA